jgi:Zn ribbon nucleic-acid-binding protein
MEKLFKYAEEIILSMGGNETNIKQITEEIKQRGYTTIEEVKSHLENYYTEDKDFYEGAELCPHCSHENNFVWIEGTSRVIKCKECGEEMLLCSLCDMDTVDCSKCPY